MGEVTVETALQCGGRGESLWGPSSGAGRVPVRGCCGRRDALLACDVMMSPEPGQGLATVLRCRGGGGLECADAVTPIGQRRRSRAARCRMEAAICIQAATRRVLAVWVVRALREAAEREWRIAREVADAEEPLWLQEATRLLGHNLRAEAVRAMQVRAAVNIQRVWLLHRSRASAYDLKAGAKAERCCVPLLVVCFVRRAHWTERVCKPRRMERMLGIEHAGNRDAWRGG